MAEVKRGVATPLCVYAIMNGGNNMAFQLVSAATWNKAFSDPPFGMDFPSKPSLASLEGYTPMRSTPQSAGYDFRMPFALNCVPRQRYIVPTGFKWDPSDSVLQAVRSTWATEVEDEEPIEHPEREFQYRIPSRVFLALYPRSSLGFNYGFELLNTVGIIDADYFNNEDNEGHIMVAFKVARPLSLNAGDKFCQGVIQLHAHVENDVCANGERTGGMGSTGR